MGVQSRLWTELTAAFPANAIEWRITRLSEDVSKAALRPQLRYDSLMQRLKSVLTPTDWSLRYVNLADEAVCAELSILGNTRSSVLSLLSPERTAVIAAQDAFVYAAEAFGIVPPADSNRDYWVDYDAEHHCALYEPDLEEPVTAEVLPDADKRPDGNSEKSAGHQAIDRLVDRLKQEGFGLEAARLLIRFGGYGQNPEEARGLYGELRALLLKSELKSA